MFILYKEGFVILIEKHVMNGVNVLEINKPVSGEHDAFGFGDYHLSRV